MNTAPTALLVDDDASTLISLDRIMRSRGFETFAAANLHEANAQLEKERPDLAILDLNLPDGNGADLIEGLTRQPGTDVLIVSGATGADVAESAMKAGAMDYLTKPIDFERFNRALRKVKEAVAARTAGDPDSPGALPRGVVCASEEAQAVRDKVWQVAPTDSTVLLRGETGVGKDVFARLCHRWSDRAARPLVSVNCGAIQATLIESELFGHERGSFTGATAVRRGLFEQADTGTLFLDEITAMTLDCQVKVLRLLETGMLRRVGAEKEIEVDVRVIAATNRDPWEAVKEGRLREDLFFRIHVFPIHVPPLRDRVADIEPLARQFLEQLNVARNVNRTLEPCAVRALEGYSWPGNVRELRNTVERAHVMASESIRDQDLSFDCPSRSQTGGLQVKPDMSIAEVERMLILAALNHLQWDKQAAANSLGISLKTLYNRLSAYGVGRRSKSLSTPVPAPLAPE